MNGKSDKSNNFGMLSDRPKNATIEASNVAKSQLSPVFASYKATIVAI